jgi:hypothetical protein
LTLPSFDELRDAAKLLVTRHATTQAYNRARHPGERQEEEYAPIGKPWTVPHNENEDIEMSGPNFVEMPSGLPEPPIDQESDFTLANSALLIRDAIWWKEVCKAIAEGDPGRVWEILKVNFLEQDMLIND